MAPMNLNRKRTYAQPVRARPVVRARPTVPAFKYFYNVEFKDCMVNRAFSVIVMVDAKFHLEAHGDRQRFILMDAPASWVLVKSQVTEKWWPWLLLSVAF
uniref:Uncharacterized protein n=1 Tax=Oryza meridionalis TaxID=40149 RepID=A0A0E0FAV0_9ORYZ